MEALHHKVLTGIFVVEVVNMEAQDYHPPITHLDHPKVVTEAIATTTIEAIGTEVL